MNNTSLIRSTIGRRQPRQAQQPQSSVVSGGSNPASRKAVGSNSQVGNLCKRALACLGGGKKQLVAKNYSDKSIPERLWIYLIPFLGAPDIESYQKVSHAFKRAVELYFDRLIRKYYNENGNTLSEIYCGFNHSGGVLTPTGYPNGYGGQVDLLCRVVRTNKRIWADNRDFNVYGTLTEQEERVRAKVNEELDGKKRMRAYLYCFVIYSIALFPIWNALLLHKLYGPQR